MRCRACDCELNDYEVRRKDPETGEFLDTCSGCLVEIRRATKELEGLPSEFYIVVDDDGDLL